MDRFLVVMPDFDLGTAYMSKWSEPLIRHAKDRGMDVVKVTGPDVNKRVVLGKLEAVKPRLVCLNGHGDRDTYCGHGLSSVLDVNSAGALSKTTTYVRACDCLGGLGEAAVKKGCKAFIGYSEEFVIPISDEYAATPQRDPVAKPVMEVSNAIVIGLIDNKTAKAAVENSKRLTKEYIKKLLYSKEFSEDNRFGDTLFALVTNDCSLGLREPE